MNYSMKIRKSLLLTATCVFLFVSGCTVEPEATDNDQPKQTGKTEVLAYSDVEWEKLNPARGDASPQAGTLWGDRGKEVPTGFLAKFVDGFSSPPHIHNATYRAVVIEGLIHNDDPDAAKMWMPPGSFWTQPKEESHITAAKGATNIALVEIDKGPYLVRPIEEAKDSGERPVNVDAKNVVWVSLKEASGPSVAYLWGSLKNEESNGTFLKLPAGFKGVIRVESAVFRAVVIKGSVAVEGTKKKLLPGSYFGSEGAVVHVLTNKAEGESVLYVRTKGKYEVEDIVR